MKKYIPFLLFLLLPNYIYSQIIDSIQIEHFSKKDTSYLSDSLSVNKNINELKIVKIKFNDSAFIILSKFVKPSKVSVFIVTGDYCIPCHTLIKNLKNEYSNSNYLTSKVILFLIEIPDEKKDEYNFSQKPYQCFKNIDELSSILPTTIIYAPTENQNEKFYGLQTKEIIKTINKLAEYCK